MQGPARIEFHNMPPSLRLIARIERRVGRLQRLFERLSDCRVIVAAPHRHHRAGNLFRVHIIATVPGGELVVSRDPGHDRGHADVILAIGDAFDAAERRLAGYRQRRGGDGAQHRHAQARASRRRPNFGQPFGAAIGAMTKAAAVIGG